MDTDRPTASDSTPQPRWKDARGTLRRLRQQLQAHTELPQFAEEAGTPVEGSSVKPDILTALPDSLQRLLNAYRQRQPGVELEPLYYFTSDSVDDKANRPKLAELPDEEDLVVLSCTESAADATDVQVQSHVLLLRRRKKE